MRAIVFLGPTLPLAQARARLDAIYLPPVEQAGLTSAIRTYQPDVVGIIDGMFMQAPSLWHKEILFALDQGVRVYGAGSMGALRAIETAAFGTIGIGEVYRMYASGEIEDDDEVAVAHGPPEAGYPCTSEAMVNVRATLRQASVEGVIDDVTCDRVVRIAKDIYFPLRTYTSIWKRALAEGIDPTDISILINFVASRRRDIKRADALELLETISNLPASSENSNPKFKFNRSVFFRTLYERDRTVRRNDVNIRLSEIGNYVATHDPEFPALNFDALNRGVVKVFAELLKIDPGESQIEEASARFRRQRGFTDDQNFDEWRAQNDLSIDDYRALMREIAVCREVHRWLLTCRFTTGTTQLVLDELKLKGRYSEWADAAAFSEFVMETHFPRFTTDGMVGFDFRSLIEDHVEHGGNFDGTTFAQWATEAGFLKLVDLEVELRRSKLVREFLVALQARLGGALAEETHRSANEPASPVAG